MSTESPPIPTAEATLPRSFYDRPTETVARDLVGKILLRRLGSDWLGGTIVETEAYLAEGDLASHSVRGRKRGNASMFATPGTLYVYPIHAKYCMNAVTECEGHGAAVLIRAIEPRWGIDVMQRNRNREELDKLTRGPAMLCQALQIDREQDGIDLTTDDRLRIAESTAATTFSLMQTPRIGIRQAVELPLRFLIRGNRFVSGRVRDRT